MSSYELAELVRAATKILTGNNVVVKTESPTSTGGTITTYKVVVNNGR